MYYFKIMIYLCRHLIYFASICDFCLIYEAFGITGCLFGHIIFYNNRMIIEFCIFSFCCFIVIFSFRFLFFFIYWTDATAAFMLNSLKLSVFRFFKWSPKLILDTDVNVSAFSTCLLLCWLLWYCELKMNIVVYHYDYISYMYKIWI